MHIMFVAGLCIATAGVVTATTAAEEVVSRPAVVAADDPGKPLGVRSAGAVPAPAEGPRTEIVAVPYGYVPITPYRTLDSREYSDGFLVAGDEVYFTVLTDQDDVPMIPPEAKAVTYNLAIDQTAGAGFCAIYPADDTWPGNASINWTGPWQTISNGGTVAVGYWDGDGQVAVYCDGPAGSGTYFILDITGYYV